MAQGSFDGLCESSFGHFPHMAHKAEHFKDMTGAADSPNDMSCLHNVQNKVFEYRYHMDSLNKRVVDCPMNVDQRWGMFCTFVLNLRLCIKIILLLGNTCYKLTPKLTWRESRRQCWSWGGDLAFPLDPNSEDCGIGIYSQRTEQAKNFI